MRDGNSRTPDGPTEPNEVSTEGSGVLDTGETPVLTAGGEGFGEPASVHVIVEADRTRIVLSGEVDADLAADLREATADAEATGLPIEVDAQHVTFMDSSGIAFLARIATRSTERVRVIRAPETVRFLLEVTRIGELLDVADEPAGAHEAVGADGAAAEGPGVDRLSLEIPRIGPSGRSRTSGSTLPDGVALPDDIA